MEAKALTPRDLFDPTVCYEIPPFQRPYVWTEEDQWQPLWDDVTRVADGVLEAAASGPTSTEVPRHFLGAVVVKNLPNQSGDPSRASVIDGQQRLTTLQLLLDAAQLAIEELGHEEAAETLDELVLNSAKRFRGTPKRFKLWPSRVDRRAFEHVMDNDLSVPADVAESRIAAGHAFFRRSIGEWAEASGDPDKTRARLDALAQTLQHHLQVVAIDLSGNDDDQLIFETLNDRGTPLLAADLVKNYVFQRCDEAGADVDSWSDKYWLDFDDEWWREQVSQGRLYRSRIDLFLQYWLTMRIKDEIPTDAVFSRFRSHADEPLGDVGSAEAYLTGLRRDADTFREFADLDPATARGSFYGRVVDALELGAFIPLLLWLSSDAHPVAPEQADRALAAVESWAVRRTLLRRTMKDVNKLVVAILRELELHPAASVGDQTVAFLSSQEADSRVWPTDGEMLAELPSIKVYGNIKQPRLRMVLGAVEAYLRTSWHENVELPPRLDLEHVMPQGWVTHWAADIGPDQEAHDERNRLVHTIGNLTLVTKGLNSALSNRPWTDAAALPVAPTGKEAGLGKRSLLHKYSLLALTNEIYDRHEAAWTNADIEARSVQQAERIIAIWPRGDDL